jgi:dephospho-CoA kinase
LSAATARGVLADGRRSGDNGRMIVIGLHGRIGAGKSTVARMFADHGAIVIDADRLAHAVLEEPEARREIVARFGSGVLAADGAIRRPALAERVFGPTPAHAAALRDLESIVHPRVRRRIESQLAALRQAEDNDGVRRVAVLDVPLLVPSGWAAACDLVVVVECDDKVRHGRLADRGWAADHVAAREKAWEAGVVDPPAAPGNTRSVDASGDSAYTRRQVEGIWTSLPV